MSIDWKALEENFNNFKPIAPEGEYEAEVSKVEVKKLDSGSISVKFYFKNGDYAYPWASHWWSFTNTNWAYWHHAQLLQMLGVRKEDAQSAIAQLDGVSDHDTVVKKLQAFYDKAVQKKLMHKIVVRETYDANGDVRYSDKGYKQTESEFLDPRVFIDNRRKDKKTDEQPAEQSAAEDEINLDEIPF